MWLNGNRLNRKGGKERETSKRENPSPNIIEFSDTQATLLQVLVDERGFRPSLFQNSPPNESKSYSSNHMNRIPISGMQYQNMQTHGQT